MKKRTPKTLLVRRALRVPPGRPLRIAVVADTHSRPHPKLEERLGAIAPDAVVHAGDIGDLAVLDVLRPFGELVVVRGNIDEKAVDLPDHVVVQIEDDRGPLVNVLVMHIAVYGPNLRADAARLAQRERAALVFCGHSHVPFVAKRGDVAVFNPGSIGPKRFHLPILLGLATIERSGISLVHLDAETGERWLPPPVR